METHTQQNTAGRRGSRGIDVDGLERELSSLWAEMSRSKGEGDARASVMRACVLNLILYSTRTDDRAGIDALLDEVTAGHPCRALVLVADRSATEARLAANVSTRCQLVARGATQVCREQITIEAGGAAVETVASAVAPLLVPDVPVFLWWKDIPNGDDKLFSRVVEMADRVVVDSACSSEPHIDLGRFAQLIARQGAALRASDLNWSRLTSWRAVIAHFWDVPDYRPHLDAVDRIRIDYDPLPGAPAEISAQALLIAGWLASRLGWEVEASSVDAGEGLKTTLLRAGGRRIDIEWRAVGGVAGCERMISSIVFATGDAGAEFHVRWKNERTKIETSVSIGDQQRASHVLAYESRTDGRRLSNELALLARDVVYEQALAAAARIIETLETRDT